LIKIFYYNVNDAEKRGAQNTISYTTRRRQNQSPDGW